MDDVWRLGTTTMRKEVPERISKTGGYPLMYRANLVDQQKREEEI